MKDRSRPAPCVQPFGRGSRPRARWAITGAVLLATGLTYCDERRRDPDYVWKARAEFSRGRAGVVRGERTRCFLSNSESERMADC
jgi:hypothetical protein